VWWGESGVSWMPRALPSYHASPWWNDLMAVGVVAGSDRLQGIFFKKIGNGGNTSFWHDTWMGTQPLKEVFPRLFLISAQKDCCVLELGRWTLGHWEWDLRWKRNLFVWEEVLWDLLANLLTPFHLSESIDEWRYHYSNGRF
ncbi:pantothenate synthetase, partial [Trifolium pratense]